jgi:SH3-like domain-containing protein
MLRLRQRLLWNNPPQKLKQSALYCFLAVLLYSCVAERSELDSLVFAQKTTIDASEIALPQGTVMVAVVKRPRAELRVGPGSAFILGNSILVKGTHVVVISRKKPWVKVYVPSLKKAAWTHSGYLSPSEPNDSQRTISVAAFSVVFARNKIEYAFEYPSRKRIKVMIPKGRGFAKIREDKKQVLIYASEAGGLLWLGANAVR